MSDNAPIEATGQQAEPTTDGRHGHEPGGVLGEKTELAFAVASAVALGVGWIIQLTLSEGAALTFYAVACIFGGFITVREALDNLRHKRFEIDTLVIAAAAGAALLGHWSEGALLLALFSPGHCARRHGREQEERLLGA